MAAASTQRPTTVLFARVLDAPAVRLAVVHALFVGEPPATRVAAPPVHGGLERREAVDELVVAGGALAVAETQLLDQVDELRSALLPWERAGGQL